MIMKRLQRLKGETDKLKLELKGLKEQMMIDVDKCREEKT